MTTEHHSPDIPTPARKGPAPVMEDMRNRGVVPNSRKEMVFDGLVFGGIGALIGLFGLGGVALLFTVLLSQSLLNLLSGFLPFS